MVGWIGRGVVERDFQTMAGGTASRSSAEHWQENVDNEKLAC